MKAITFLIALGVLDVGFCGELVVKGDSEIQAINLWLRPVDNQAAKPKLPDNHVEADDENPYRWKGLKPGKYVICLDPDYEDWASHCIASVPVEIGEGVKTINVKVPSGTIDLTVRFDSVEAPKQCDSAGLVFRVERLKEDGTVDPYIRQWLWTEKKDDRLVGPLDYLDSGTYRVTAFSVDEDFQTVDAAWGTITIDAATLKKGSALVTINKKVEQGAAGQPATRSESK